MSEIHLRESDRHSSCWLTVVAYVESRMSDLRSRVEGNLNWEDTIQVRAQIRELKNLLEIADAPLHTGEYDEY